MMGSIPGAVVTKAAAMGAGLKLGIVGLVMTAGLALTLSGAEASGDAFADDVNIGSGQVAGTLADASGPADTLIVQVGNGGAGGQLLVGFVDNIAFDGPGADIQIVTLDATAPAVATIEVSDNGVDWESAGDFPDTANVNIDLSPLGLDFASMVRITFVSGDEPGFDVDAVVALNQIGIDGAAITLAPPNDASPGFAEHLVTATVTDEISAIDTPIAGIPVSFAVTSGPSLGAIGSTGSAATNGSGEATFGWTGASIGVDEVTAWLDFNGSGTQDEGEPEAEALKLWFGDTGTIELSDVDGDQLAVGDLVQIEVADRDLDVSDGLDTVSVLVTSSSDGIGINVLLTETGAHTGVFTAVIELSDTSNEATGLLEAAVGDIITGTYDDEVDATDSNPDPVSDTLIVELTAEEDALEADAEEGHKVSVCHIPGGNPSNYHTLSVDEDALEAHLGHGDLEGDCADHAAELDELPSKHEQAEERKAERDEAFCERKGDSHPRCR